MDPLPPSWLISGSGAQQPHGPPLSTVDDNPGGSTSSSWRSGGWGLTTWPPSIFATGGNVCNETRVVLPRLMCSQGIYIAPRVPLLHGPTEIYAEPGGGTVLPECYSTPISYNRLRGDGTRDSPPGDVPLTDNGVSSDSRTTLRAEGPSQVPPKVCTKLPITILMLVIIGSLVGKAEVLRKVS